MKCTAEYQTLVKYEKLYTWKGRENKKHKVGAKGGIVCCGESPSPGDLEFCFSITCHVILSDSLNNMSWFFHP